MASTMYYSGLRLDRAAAARGDPEWVARVPELRARVADPSLGGPYRVDSIGKILIEDWLASHA